MTALGPCKEEQRRRLQGPAIQEVCRHRSGEHMARYVANSVITRPPRLLAGRNRGNRPTALTGWAWAYGKRVVVEMSLGLQFTGWFGELKTVIAKKLFLRSSDYVDINNVTIRTRRGTTQIDHVIISRYGVFVVETKNMSGWIFGSENDPFWIKTNRGNKLKFQNPLHQKHQKVI